MTTDLKTLDLRDRGPLTLRDLTTDPTIERVIVNIEQSTALYAEMQGNVRFIGNKLMTPERTHAVLIQTVP